MSSLLSYRLKNKARGLLIIAPLLWPLLSLPAKAADSPVTPPPRIIVSGHGEVKAKPDLAIISVGVIAQGSSAKQATDANSLAMNEAIESLKTSGIEARDLQTSRFSVQPLYASEPQRGTPPKIAAYRATSTLILTVRDLSKIGEIFQRAVALGVNNVQGPNFQFADPEKLRDEARRSAIANARAHAKLYAEGLGFALGRVLLVSEGAVSDPPRPSPARAFAAAPASAAPPASIEAGEATISADITVEWEIREAP